LYHEGAFWQAQGIQAVTFLKLIMGILAETRKLHGKWNIGRTARRSCGNNAISDRKINGKYTWSSKTLAPEPGSGHREVGIFSDDEG